MQSDYLRKISLKMLTMETRFQNPIVSSPQFDAAIDSGNPQNSGTDTNVAVLVEIAIFFSIRANYPSASIYE